MKKKKEEFYLGDKIKTKKTFKPILPDRTRFDNEGKLFEGIVVDKRADFLLIDFGKEYPFTTHLAGVLANRTGHAVDKKDVERIETTEYDSEEEKDYANLLKELMFEDIKKIPKEIRSCEDFIASNSAQIRSIYNEIKEREGEIRTREYALNSLKEKQANTSYDTSHYVKQYKALLKNKRIKSLKIVDFHFANFGKGVLLTTNNLMYKRGDFEFDSGAYKIFLPLSMEIKPIAINYKRHVQKMLYHHPCIKNSKLCLGTNVETEVMKAIRAGDIINAAHLLILFLEEPNYGTPYIDDLSFSCAQDVTISPENDEDWFKPSYWGNNEKWDGEKFTEETEKIREEQRGDIIRN